MRSDTHCETSVRAANRPWAPRWMPACLWSTLTLGTILAGAWWLICPERTAERFTHALATGRFGIANRLLANARWSFDNDATFVEVHESNATARMAYGWYVGETRPVKIVLVREPLTSSDALRGIRRMKLDQVGNFAVSKDQIWFIVRRAEIFLEHQP